MIDRLQGKVAKTRSKQDFRANSRTGEALWEVAAVILVTTGVRQVTAGVSVAGAGGHSPATTTSCSPQVSVTGNPVRY